MKFCNEIKPDNEVETDLIKAAWNESNSMRFWYRNRGQKRPKTPVLLKKADFGVLRPFEKACNESTQFFEEIFMRVKRVVKAINSVEKFLWEARERTRVPFVTVNTINFVDNAPQVCYRCLDDACARSRRQDDEEIFVDFDEKVQKCKKSRFFGCAKKCTFCAQVCKFVHFRVFCKTHVFCFFFKNKGVLDAIPRRFPRTFCVV